MKQISRLVSALLAGAGAVSSTAFAHHEDSMASQGAHVLDHALWLLAPAAIIALVIGSLAARRLAKRS